MSCAKRNEWMQFLSLSPSAPGWQLGFRPFFLIGSLWGVLLIVYWVLYQLGFAFWSSHMAPVFFHAHEMIFGFSSAIVLGFLFTASQNWVGKRGIHGRRLQFVFLLWFAGRILALLPGPLRYVEAFIDGSFFLSSAAMLFAYLSVEGQKRNRIFLLLLVAMGLLDVAMHVLAAHQPLWARQCYLWALGIILIMVTIIGGRVIPLFTKNAVRGANPVKSTVIEAVVLPATFLVFLLEPFTMLYKFAAIVALVATFAHAARWLLWKPWQARRVPIVWVLHFGYFWFIPGMLLQSLSYLGRVPFTLSVHAFTVGVISTMILGMTSRVALGHTGRPIKARPSLVLAYVLVTLSVLARVFLPLSFPNTYLLAIGIGGGVWALAYAIFVWQYSGILVAARSDGKPG